MQTYHVARVTENKDADHAEVTFLESARFYRLLKSNKHYKESLALLKAAAANNTALRVLFTTPNGEVIEKVETLPPLKK